MGPSRRYRGLSPLSLGEICQIHCLMKDLEFNRRVVSGVWIGREGRGVKHTMSDCVTWPQMQRGLLSSTTEAEMMAGGRHAPTFHDANTR